MLDPLVHSSSQESQLGGPSSLAPHLLPASGALGGKGRACLPSGHTSVASLWPQLTRRSAVVEVTWEEPYLGDYPMTSMPCQYAPDASSGDRRQRLPEPPFSFPEVPAGPPPRNPGCCLGAALGLQSLLLRSLQWKKTQEIISFLILFMSPGLFGKVHFFFICRKLNRLCF